MRELPTHNTYTMFTHMLHLQVTPTGYAYKHTSYTLQVTCTNLQATCYKLHLQTYKLQVASYTYKPTLHVTSYTYKPKQTWSRRQHTG